AVDATPASASGLAREKLPHLVDGRGTPPRGRGAKAWLAWAMGARRRAREFAPDVVHLHLSTPALAAAAACVAGGRPSVWTFHLLPEANWPLDFMTRFPCAWALRFV